MSIGIDPKFPNAIVAAIVVDETTLATYLPDRVIPLTLDRNGALLVRVNGSITATLGTAITIADAMAFASGSIVASAVVGYNGASFDRVRSVGDDSDAVASDTLGRLLNVVRATLFNGASWDRQRSLVDNADAQAVGVNGLAGTVARMFGFNGATYDRLRSGADNADGVAVGTLGRLFAVVRGSLFNGSTWDRMYGNTESTLLASAARTATTTSTDQTNYNARGVHVAINVTVAGTSNLTVTVQGKDPISGTYYTILAGAAITGTGITILKIYPGITAVANGSANDILPRTFRVSCAKGDASSWTYSVAASLVV